MLSFIFKIIYQSGFICPGSYLTCILYTSPVYNLHGPYVTSAFIFQIKYQSGFLCTGSYWSSINAWTS